MLFWQYPIASLHFYHDVYAHVRLFRDRAMSSSVHGLKEGKRLRHFQWIDGSAQQKAAAVPDRSGS
jgi:hypothetical protein